MTFCPLFSGGIFRGTGDYAKSENIPVPEEGEGSKKAPKAEYSNAVGK